LSPGVDAAIALDILVSKPAEAGRFEAAPDSSGWARFGFL
jgi:hypothetical protein